MEEKTVKSQKPHKEKKEKVNKPSKIKGFFNDFKKFITKGNIVDLAVAVVVGGAFGKIVSSLVSDIIMPLVGALIGRASVADLKWVLIAATAEKAEVAILYGHFLQMVIDFLIISFFIFLALRLLVKAKEIGVKVNEKVVTLIKEEKNTNHEIEEIAKAELVEEAKAELVETAKEQVKDQLLDEVKKEQDQAELVEVSQTESITLEENMPAKPQQTYDLLVEIRDLLKAKQS
ncbi:MAG: large conductance mechanosensitive channel protein MscL [Clostridia bacterium]